MSTTESPRDFSDLHTDLLHRVRADGTDTDGTTTITTLAKRYINVALLDMHLGTTESVPWAERNTTLTTHPKYTTGTVAVSVGSTTVTGTSTLWNTANDYGENNARVGGKIKFSSNDTYTVTAVASDTSLTINTGFVGSAALSGASYTYFEDDYALHADFLRPVNITKFDDNNQISIISRTEFRKLYPRNSTLGRPSICMFFDDEFSGDTTRVRKVRFTRTPDDAYIIPYSFITNKLAISSTGTYQEMLSADADEPIVPLQYRYVIVLKALEIWYRDRKDDQRSAEVRQEYIDTMRRILADQEIGSPRMMIRPKQWIYANKAKRPWKGPGRYSTDSRFDNIEDR